MKAECHSLLSDLSMSLNEKGSLPAEGALCSSFRSKAVSVSLMSLAVSYIAKAVLRSAYLTTCTVS